jgi:hypothetical protein
MFKASNVFFRIAAFFEVLVVSSVARRFRFHTSCKPSFRVACLPKVEIRVKVTLRLPVYRQSICLGVKPLETHDQRIFSPTEPLCY